MPHDPQLTVATAHEQATYKVFSAHMQSCTECKEAAKLGNQEVYGCLDGRAAWDEWRIANMRLRNLRKASRENT